MFGSPVRKLCINIYSSLINVILQVANGTWSSIDIIDGLKSATVIMTHLEKPWWH